MNERGIKVEREKKDKLLCAAIHIDDGKRWPNQPENIKSGFVVCGYRHGSIFAAISALLQLGNCTVSNIHDTGVKITQGFLSSQNEFLDRKEAAKVAYAAGQINEKIEELYSEDLY